MICQGGKSDVKSEGGCVTQNVNRNVIPRAQCKDLFEIYVCSFDCMHLPCCRFRFC